MKYFILLEFLSVYAASSIISNALYSISVVGLLLMTIYEYYKMNPRLVILPDKAFNIVYLPFFFLISISSLFLGDYASVLDSFKYIYWSICPFALFYFALQYQFHERAIITAISLGLLTFSLYGFYQFFTSPQGTRIQSYTYHPNVLSEMLVLSIPFLVIYIFFKKENLRLRIFLGIITLLSCCILAFTGSRGGMLGLCAGGVIFFIIRLVYNRKFNARKVLARLLALVLVMACVSGTFMMNFDHSGFGIFRNYDNERVLLWQSSYNMWKDHKILGVGLTNWKENYQEHYISPRAKEPNLGQPHNTFAYFFSTTGFVGGIGYLFFTFGMFWYLCKKLKYNTNNVFLNAFLWSFLAIMIHGLVNNGIMHKNTMKLYSIYLGISLASVVWYQKKQDLKKVFLDAEKK